MTDDPYTMEARLCDDHGLVSDEQVEPGQPGTVLNPELTYRKLLNNLRARNRNPDARVPYEGEPFVCTGSAHLAGEHIRCTSPAHNMSDRPVPPEMAYVLARCAGRGGLHIGRYRHCDWEGLLLRGPLDRVPRCPRCGALAEAVGSTPFASTEG